MDFLDIAITIATTFVVAASAGLGAGVFLHYRFGKSVRSVADQLKNVRIS